jgi:hypothetical protein
MPHAEVELVLHAQAGRRVKKGRIIWLECVASGVALLLQPRWYHKPLRLAWMHSGFRPFTSTQAAVDVESPIEATNLHATTLHVMNDHL